MAQLYVQGRVFYAPGTWGTKIPVAAASIEIVDNEPPGGAPDGIWSGRTDDTGYFGGWSRDWQDRVAVTLIKPDSRGLPQQTTSVVADPTDVLSLTIHISDAGREVWLPYPYVGDAVEPPDVVVGWGPVNASPPIVPWRAPTGVVDPAHTVSVVAAVNGSECRAPVDITDRVRAETDAGTAEIHIDVFEPAAVALMTTITGTNEIADWAGDRLGIPQRWRTSHDAPMGDSTIALLAGCAIVKTGAGLDLLLVSVGVAALHGVDNGYPHLTIEPAGPAHGVSAPGFRLTLRR